MKNKIYLSFLTMMFVLIFFIGSAGAEAAKKLHPRNRELIKRGIIPMMKYFPEVPRITAQEALALYNSGKGFFIGIGYDARRLENGWILLNYFTYDPKRLKALKDKVIVTYCG